MFIEMDFSYNGISSTTKNVSIVRTDGNGVIEQHFGVNRAITKEKLPKNNTFYYYGEEVEPITFPIEIMKKDGSALTKVDRQDLAEWLIQDDFCPFISNDFPDLIYYCKVSGDSIFNNISTNQGTIKLTFECDSAYAYSPVQDLIYDLSSNTSATMLSPVITNTTNVKEYYNYYPVMVITMCGSTSVSINNLSDTIGAFQINNLATDEVLIIDNRMQQMSSNKGNYHYDDSNKNWFRLIHGSNSIQVIGKCKIEFKLQFPMMV